MSAVNTLAVTNAGLGRVSPKSAGINIIKYGILIAITIIVFLPIFITLFASLKTSMQLGSEFPLKPPDLANLFLENYRTVFIKGKMLLGFRNSIFLVAASVAINAVLGSMTAYTLCRFNFRFKKLIVGLFMLGMVIPNYITEIARFPVIRALSLYNTIGAPILIYAATDLMQIYIYTQFVDKISNSIDESAMMDGASYFSVFWRIVFPLLMPATATLAIIKAVDVINDMYIPYLYMPSGKLRTLTTTLMDFSSARAGKWEELSAAIMLVLIPTLIIYFVFRKFIFAGVVAGAVKE